MRFLALLCITLSALFQGAVAQEQIKKASLPLGLGACYTPVEPFLYKLDKSDPLYDTARDEHQRYLEELEDYVNCLDRKRSEAIDALRTSFNLFKSNFGLDAVFKYAKEKEAARQ